MSAAHPGYCQCSDCGAMRILCLDDYTLTHGGEQMRSRYIQEATKRITKIDAERSRIVKRIEWLRAMMEKP